MATPTLDVPTIPVETRPHQPRAPLKERVGKKLLARFGARRRLGAPLERIPEYLQRTARQVALSLELIEDFRSGRYRGMPWGSIAILTGALLYAVNPADVLPDAALGLGGFDDAVILALATRLVRRQLEDYCDFKGYSWNEYFAAATGKSAGFGDTTPVTVEARDMPAY